ncbi:MAG: nitrilase-related carbon-nitrogen hydrolase, partial [candidate division WOR-3 bacterium]
MKIAIAQLNPTVGDIKGNIELVRKTITNLEPEQPDLVIFPEMFLTGYPPGDLLERSWFIQRAEQGMIEVAKISKGCSCAILIGGVARSNQKFGRGLYNCAFGFYQGKEVYRQAKWLLPFYDVFDEVRYF